MIPTSPSRLDGEGVQPETSAHGLGLNSVKLALAFVLSSCTQYPQAQRWQQYPPQRGPAPIQAPAMRIVAPGTPLPYNHVQHTRIAKPKPHPYPKNSQSATPWCMRDGVSDAPQRQAFYDARYGWGMYQIKAGDTRSAIQRDFGLTSDQLNDLNPALPADENLIQDGFFLRVY